MLETAISLAVIGSLYATFYWPWVQSAAMQWQNQNAANQLKDVVEGAQRYVGRNYATIYTAASGGVVTITGAQLQAAGDLSPSLSLKNIYGQSYAVLARQLPVLPAPNNQRLEVVVTTLGGDVLTDIDCAEVSKMVGSAGGCIYSADTTSIAGSGAGWSAQVVNYVAAGANQPTVGRPAAMVYFADGGVSSAYLNRNNTGNPEDNRMHTAIDMNGNNVNNASDVALATGQKLSGAGFPVGALADGTVVSKPSCPTGSAKLDLSLAKIGSNGTGKAMSGQAVNSVDLGGAWQVNIIFQTEDGQFHATSTYGAANGIVYCQ